jgi:hypothetical protein
MAAIWTAIFFKVKLEMLLFVKVFYNHFNSWVSRYHEIWKSGFEF